MRHRLHWLAVQPTPYNDYLFRALAADPELDLTVHFREHGLASHPWKETLGVGYQSRTYRRRFGLDWQALWLAATDRRSFFVIAGWDHPTAQLAALLRSTGGRYAIWTDTPRAGGRSLVRGALRTTWLRFLFRTAHRILGTGAPGVAALEALGCPREKLVSFPFFVDLDAFQSVARSERRPITFASSGRLELAIKGQDVAVEALAAASARTGFRDYRYRIAGVGPDEASLRALVNARGLADRVEFAGWIEAAALPAFYAAADVLLHPARVDPFPVAVLEAMAASLPILGSAAAGSVRDRVTDGVNGFIHAPGDPQALSRHIELLFRQPSRVTQLGHEARRTAEAWPVSRGVELVKSVVG